LAYAKAADVISVTNPMLNRRVALGIGNTEIMVICVQPFLGD
jgi:hypothetical protein